MIFNSQLMQVTMITYVLHKRSKKEAKILDRPGGSKHDSKDLVLSSINQFRYIHGKKIG